MRHVIENREPWIAGTLSFLVALTTLLFVIPKITTPPLLKFFETSNFYYVFFALLILLTFGLIAATIRPCISMPAVRKILFIWLPGVLILGFGTEEAPTAFRYLHFLALGIYVLAAGTYLSNLYIRSAWQGPAGPSFSRWLKRQGLPALFWVLFVTVLFFSFGLYRLTEFAAVDEPLWLNDRIEKYWRNIGERDWKGTTISDKPGITVALSTGIGLLLTEPREYRLATHPIVDGQIRHEIEAFYRAFRLPFLIVITLFLPLFYFFSERLFGRSVALFFYTFLGLSPILIGMSKIINPDSLLWLFGPLAVLSYFTYQKERRFSYLIAAGVFLGLALLTKYVANVIFIFLLSVIFLEWIFRERNREDLVVYLKRSFAELGVLTFSALAVFYLLFPAVWLRPEKLISATLYSQAFEKVALLFLGILFFIFIDARFNKARVLEAILGGFRRFRRLLAYCIAGIFLLSGVLVIVNVLLGMRWYNFPELLASPKSIALVSDLFGVFLTNFYPLLFALPPMALLGLFLALVFLLKRKLAFTLTERLILYCVVFILLYFVGAAVNGVAMIVRYQIMIFPVTALLAGLGWALFSVELERMIKKFPVHALTPVLLLIITLSSVYALWRSPFPLSYNSILLPPEYYIDIKDMGPGSYEVASFLNTLPNAVSTRIWTDKEGVCRFFVGRCFSGMDWEELRENGIDYVVVSAARKSRTARLIVPKLSTSKRPIIRFHEFYDQPDPFYELHINDRPNHYVRIYRFVE